MEFKRIKIVYFSPTKATKKVLENIAKGIGIDEVVDYNLTHSKEISQTIETFNDEIVIIGAPVYAGRLPVVAVERFKQLKANNTLAIFVVVYGNRAFEDALLELKNLVIDLGFTPFAGAAFVAEHSYSTDELPIAAGRPDSMDIEDTKKFALKIKEKIKNLVTSQTQIDLEIPGDFPYKDAMPPNTVAPVVNENLCVECGMCIDICPTGAILESMETDASLCIRCCACVKNCPDAARVIEDIGWKAMGARLNANCSARKKPEIFL
jgi:ferredoxin/flavodoxin